MSNIFTYTKQIGNLTNLQTYLESSFTGISTVTYDTFTTIVTVTFTNDIIAGDIVQLNKAMSLYTDSITQIYDLNIVPVQTSNNNWTVIKSWKFPSNQNDTLYVWTALNITSWITNPKIVPSSYFMRLMNVTTNSVIVSGTYTNTSSTVNSMTISSLTSSQVISLELQVKVSVATDILNIKSLEMIY